MIIKNLSLSCFRSYSKKSFDFSSGVNLIVGQNASGKTNMLEGVYLLASGKSLRAGTDSEMINYGQEMARLSAKIKDGRDERTDLEIVLTTGRVMGISVAKKRYFVNGVGRRMVDFVGNLRCVYFGPESIEIILGSPSVRRGYLDGVLEAVDQEYRRANLSYQKGLRQRNKLLEQIRDEGKPRSILFFWDRLLIENGEIVARKREDFLSYINDRPDYFGDLNLTYKKSLISPQRLEEYAEAEVASGMTLVGPHRDDFQVDIKENDRIRDLHAYGSRGEQRTAIFSMKLAELEFISEKTEDRPVLLLDDVFSELDHKRREHLLEVIPKQQTIITTADIHLIEPEYRKKVEIIGL